jgi:2-polyprenyl-3-methyl-5-hydroxy-6-metoxy-1,4-benzoquinol methylase
MAHTVDATSSIEIASTHAKQVQRGDRFEFGKNWSRFLGALNDERIFAAEGSLRRMLEIDALVGKTFLDVGSGSGLFSLAARRLGARVHSFDFDPNSVACTEELRRRYFPGDDAWTVQEASALDVEYLKSLGQFDVVYSWGVLHHTGSMWTALDNVHRLVARRGKLFVAIYNDQGTRSRRWHKAKRIYNTLPRLLKTPWALVAIAPTEFKAALSSLLAGRLGNYLRAWTRVETARGMSRWHDVIDWVGGYPFEYAAPDEIFNFYRERGFALTKLVCKGAGSGCVQYVFEKSDDR